MKKTFLMIISLIMIIVNSNFVLAEEETFADNFVDNDVRDVMKNTVIIRPFSSDAFVYGKRYNLEKQGEPVKENNQVIVNGEFLKEIFKDKEITENAYNISDFAKNNDLEIKDVKGNIYLYSKEYKFPSKINDALVNYFGIYVKDGAKGDGSFEHPVGSFAEAKMLVQNIKNKAGLPDGGITVYFREGNYIFDRTMNFEPDDSGTEGSPVVYKAYKNEKVSFGGGISIKGKEFHEITDPDMKKKIPHPENVVVVNIAEKISEFNDSFKKNDPSTWSLFYNDLTLNNARWPDNDYTLTGEVISDGGGKRGVGFSFVVDDTRIKNWANEKDPRIFGYFGFDWYGERKKIASVDMSNLSIKTDDFAQYGVTAGKRFYTYNMACELDYPGEFYYDTKFDDLYFYPVEGKTDSPDFLNNEVKFALLSQEMMIFDDAQYINFENIIFENSLDLIAKVNKNCNHIAFKGNTYKNIAKGIELQGFDNTISSCDFYNIFNKPIAAYGGDRATLTPSGNEIINNKLWNFNISSRTNTSAIDVRGCGDHVAHNEILNSPHTTMIMGGNDNIIEYNEFYHNLVDNAQDAGMMYGGRNLSEQGNIIRNNYFHDPACHSIGAIYFDDGMSGNNVESNIFENTGTGIFVHGGLGIHVKDNLFIGGSGSCLGGSSYSGSWKMETATSQAANTLLWMLKQFPYQSEMWQKKYQRTLKHLESDENPILMYETVFTGNICLDKKPVQFPERDMEVIEYNNNTVLEGEEAKNFEIPEKYLKIKSEAGVYIDEYRKNHESLTEFRLMRPFNKQANVEGSSVYFKWEDSANANKYHFTLATDKDFKNIISNKMVPGSFAVIEKLNYSNTRYFWKVEAIANSTNSVKGEKTKYSSDEYFTFTTKQTEKINKEKLDERIKICESFIEKVTESENPGDYKLGTRQLMQDMIDSYKKSSERGNVSQKDINNMTLNLKNEFAVLTYRKNPEVFDMKKSLETLVNWNFTPNQTLFENNVISYFNQQSPSLGTANKLSPHYRYKFKVRFDALDDGWMGIGTLAQNSPKAVPWSGNPMYFTIIKKDTVEFQKWGRGKNINLSFENKSFKNNEWNLYEFIIDVRDDGTNKITWKINDELVTEYIDDDVPIAQPGYLYFFNGPKDARLDIMPADEQVVQAKEEE